MTEISGALGVPGTGGGDAAAARDELGETFDNFLTLLTTQLQYQDPLSPMDSNQFTEQLVHFTNVEQSIAQTEKLEELLALSGFNQTAQAVGFIGKQVEVEDSFIELAGGGGTMEYELADNAARTRISIVDENGTLVRSLEGQTEAGRHTLSWDGRDGAGQQQPDGVYSVYVTAVDRDNATVEVAPLSYATVKGVRSEDGKTWLEANGAEIALDDVRAIRSPQADATVN